MIMIMHSVAFGRLRQTVVLLSGKYCLTAATADLRGNRSSRARAQAAGVGRVVWGQLWGRLRSRSFQRCGGKWLLGRGCKLRCGVMQLSGF